MSLITIRPYDWISVGPLLIDHSGVRAEVGLVLGSLQLWSRADLWWFVVLHWVDAFRDSVQLRGKLLRLIMLLSLVVEIIEAPLWLLMNGCSTHRSVVVDGVLSHWSWLLRDHLRSWLLLDHFLLRLWLLGDRSLLRLLLRLLLWS